MEATMREQSAGTRAARILPCLRRPVLAISGGRAPTHNVLLAALPEDEYDLLSPMLEWGQWPAGMVLQNSGFAAKHVYFPVGGIVSVMCTAECGAGAEVAMVGNEGVVGIGAFLGGDCAASECRVQFAACGYRVPAHALQRRFDEDGALRDLLLRYTQAFISQVAQSVVCIKCHSVEQRLSGWLLSSLDRLPSDSLMVPQSGIATALGVRREAVSLATKRLHDAGLLDRGRRKISVLDREGLESRACECSAAVKRSIAGLMSGSHARDRLRSTSLRPVRLGMHGPSAGAHGPAGRALA